jgi:hypothetical protein
MNNTNEHVYGETASPYAIINIQQNAPGSATMEITAIPFRTIVLDSNTSENNPIPYSDEYSASIMIPKNIGCGITLDNTHVYNFDMKIYGCNSDTNIWEDLSYVISQEPEVNLTQSVIITPHIIENEPPIISNISCFEIIYFNFFVNSNDIPKSWCDIIICITANVRYSVCYNLYGCTKFYAKIQTLSDQYHNSCILPETTISSTTIPPNIT